MKDKYNVGKQPKDIEKRTFRNIIFSSEMEMKFYRDILVPDEESGKIVNIIIQPKYMIQPKFSKYGKNHLPINYVSDFEVEFFDGTVITYEVKGLPTEASKIKRKMFDYVYPDKILKWMSLSSKFGGWIEYDELIRLRANNKRKKNANKSLQQDL